jgi:hypothetical protein
VVKFTGPKRLPDSLTAVIHLTHNVKAILLLCADML